MEFVWKIKQFFLLFFLTQTQQLLQHPYSKQCK